MTVFLCHHVYYNNLHNMLSANFQSRALFFKEVLLWSFLFTLTVSHTNNGFSYLCKHATDFLLLLFTQYKTTWFTTISSQSHCTTWEDDGVQQSHVAKRLSPTTVIWSEPLKISCHVIVTQQRPTVEQSARKFWNLPLQSKDRTWVNCMLISVWHQNNEPDSCAAWVSYRQINCHCKKYKSIKLLVVVVNWASSFNPLLGRTRSRAGVEQPH